VAAMALTLSMAIAVVSLRSWPPRAPAAE
jgi:hypothetical protein